MAKFQKFVLIKNFFIKNWREVLLTVLIIFLGNRLREFSYASVPLPGETADEYSFAWLGISLIKDRYPIAWSGLSAYKSHDYQRINVDGIYDENKDPNREPFSIDKPWFDHPPLFGLMIGGYGYLKGVRDFKDASVIIIRRPMLKIALFSSILLYVLARRLYGKTIAFFSLILYSVTPSLVISSRLVLAENALVPLFLLTAILFNEYVSNEKRKYLFVAYGVCFISMWVKLSSMASILALFLLGLWHSKQKFVHLKIAGLTFLLFFISYVLYGALFGIDTFFAVLKANSQRIFGAGAEIFYSALMQHKITNLRYLTDGWIIVFWISFFVTCLEIKNGFSNRFIPLIFVVSYLFVFLIFGSESYGWYRYPFYPFLIIIFSSYVYKLWKRADIISFSAVALIPFGTAFHRLVGIEGFEQYVFSFRLNVVFLIFLTCLYLLKKNLSVIRAYMLAVIIFLVYISIKLVYFYDLGNWYFVT